MADLPASTPKPRFAVLDAWRGIGAVAVVVFHLDAATHLAWLGQNAYVAVDLFFVLSGFVLASAYQDRLTSGGGLGGFVLRRFGRLYPLHLFVLMVYLALEFRLVLDQDPDAFTDSTTWPALVGNLLMVQALGRFRDSWNFVAWSISIDFWVSIAFALGAVLLGRRLLAGVIVAGLALLAFIETLTQDMVVDGVRISAAMTDFAKYAFGFVLGVLAFNLFRWARSRNWRSNAALDVAALLAAGCVFVFAGDLVMLSSDFIFAAVVTVFAFEQGPVSAFLRRPAWRLLGTLSYSIYMIHSIFTQMVFHYVVRLGHHLHMQATRDDASGHLMILGGPWAMDAVVVACVVVVVASSYLSFRFVEEPGRTFFNALSAGLQMRPALQLARMAVIAPFAAALSFGEVGSAVAGDSAFKPVDVAAPRDDVGTEK